MQNPYKIFMLLLLMAFVTTNLTSCGRYSAPYPVEGSNFPHSYPRGQENIDG